MKYYLIESFVFTYHRLLRHPSTSPTTTLILSLRALFPSCLATPTFPLPLLLSPSLQVNWAAWLPHTPLGNADIATSFPV